MTDEIDLYPQLKAKADEANIELTAIVLPLLGAMIQTEGVPARLCHYTDFAGLDGILRTRRLWATYAKTLNDASEQKYGQDVLTAYLRTKVSEKVREDMGDSVVHLKRIFVSCFCEDSRVLSMWTNYARLGGGYCLEFDGPQLFSGSFPPHSVRWNLKMIYGTELPQPLVDLVNVLCDFAARGQVEAVLAGSWLSILALKFKHPAFTHEREWRVVVQDPEVSSLAFRAGHSDIKPYIELSPVMAGKSSDFPLKKIIFGPTLRHDEVLIETISLLLERHGHTGVEVESTGIPYRL
jgi:hypothetical protein